MISLGSLRDAAAYSSDANRPARMPAPPVGHAPPPPISVTPQKIEPPQAGTSTTTSASTVASTIPAGAGRLGGITGGPILSGGPTSTGVVKIGPNGQPIYDTTVEIPSRAFQSANDPYIDEPTYFSSRGISQSDVDWIMKQDLTNNPALAAWWTDNVVGFLDPADNVYKYELTEKSSYLAAAKKWTPAQFYNEALIDLLAGRKLPNQPPPLPTTTPHPITITPVATSSTTKTLALVALAMGVAYLLLACGARTHDMPGFIEKRNIISPFIRTIAGAGVNGALGSVSTPCTDPAFFGGGFIPAGAALAQSSDQTTYPAGVLGIPQVAARVSIAAKNDEELMAITLAPDSAYPDFHVWTRVDGTLQALHGNIENPILGWDKSNPDIYITMPQMIPTFADGATRGLIWDSVVVRDAVFTGGLRVVPLKLYFWYGMMPFSSPSRRASLTARTRVQLGAAQTCDFIVPVLGRRTVTVRWLNATAAGSISTFGAFTLQSGAAPPSNPVEPFLTTTAPLTGPTVTSQEGEISIPAPKIDGLTMIDVQYTAPGGGDGAPGLELYVIGYD